MSLFITLSQGPLLVGVVLLLALVLSFVFVPLKRRKRRDEYTRPERTGDPLMDDYLDHKWLERCQRRKEAPPGET